MLKQVVLVLGTGVGWFKCQWTVAIYREAKAAKSHIALKEREKYNKARERAVAAREIRNRELIKRIYNLYSSYWN